MSIWEHLKSGLSKTRGKLMSQLGQLLTVGDIDESFLEELEKYLFQPISVWRQQQKLFPALKIGCARNG